MAKETLEIEITATDKTGGAIGAMGVALGNLASRALEMGITVVSDAVSGIANGLQSMVKQAMDAELVNAQLEAVLQSTGGAAGVTADMANQLAEKLSTMTRYEDDAIVSAESMLLTFTNIGKDVFPTALQSVLDMSTAMGQDLQTSAIQVGKALNDPVAGMGALQRVGVTFTDDQKALIEKLVESGDKMGAQKLILAELTKEFGGSATAAGDTFAGKLDILQNRLGNVGEKIGTAMLPALTTLTDKLIDFVNSDRFEEWITNVSTWLEEKLPVAIDSAVKFWDEKLKPAFDEWGPIVRDDILPALGQIGDVLGVILPPAISAASKATILMAWIFKNIVLPPIQSVVDSVQLLYEKLVQLKDFVSSEQGKGALEGVAKYTTAAAGLANPFVGLSNLAGQGLGNLGASMFAPDQSYAALGVAGATSAGGGTTVVNVNAGSVLSFMDQSALESWLRPLIQQWMGQ